MLREPIEELIYTWWPTAAGWMAVTGNVTAVLWSASDGDIDLLWLTIATITVVVICWLLVVKQVRVSANKVTADATSPIILPSDEQTRASNELRSQRLIAAIGPAVLATFCLAMLLFIGGVQIVAPAKCIPTNGTYCALIDGELRKLKNQTDGHGQIDIRVGTSNPKLLEDFSDTELGGLTAAGLGLKFRIERSPNVYKCEVASVTVTVLDIDPLEPIVPAVAAAIPHPLVWVAQFPASVKRGDVIDAKLVSRVDDAPKIEHGIPNLQVGVSQPFILRFTSQVPALYKVRVDVHVDAGWRSTLYGPIRICEGIGIPLYDPNDVFGGGPEAAPAPSVDDGEAAPAASASPHPPAPTADPSA